MVSVRHQRLVSGHGSIVGHSLRTLKIATGGRAAEVEARRMVSEKIEAGLAMQTLALTGGLGLTADGAATKMVAHIDAKCGPTGAD
jgi:hypothetical protein